MGKLNRNDSCWCGSHKKYKYCHLKGDTILEDFENKGFPLPGKELYRTEEEIEGIRKSAVITKGLLDMVDGFIGEGITTLEIDRRIAAYTKAHGGIAATLGYNGFTHSCCVSINEVVCHGIPSQRLLKNGDIVNVDVTTILDGYYSDASRMYLIGDVDDAGKKIVAEAKECLERAIRVVKPYQPIEVIGEAIEPYANSLGYSVVADFGGHGIGLKFHEDPHINHFITNTKTMIMVPGMVFTVEPMINEKGHEVEILDDDWTVVTVDGGRSAQWEHTILVTEDGAEILV